MDNANFERDHRNLEGRRRGKTCRPNTEGGEIC